MIELINQVIHDIMLQNAKISILKKYSTLPNKRHDQNNRQGTFKANSKQQKMAALRHSHTVN